LNKVLGTYVGIDPNYPQTYLEIWLLHSKVIAWGTCCTQRMANRFQLMYMRMRNNNYMKNILVYEKLKCEEDESKVLLLFDDPNDL
jgi:hypothetical protein